MKSTIYFEPINGYLVRMYPVEVENDTRIKYNAVCSVQIDGNQAIVKGAIGAMSKKNLSDLAAELKGMGVDIATYERYDDNGNLRHTITRER
jgi:hypothetical protein